MKPFDITELRDNTVLDLYALKSSIDTDPTYQRQSEIWELPKKQLLVDSIINGFDIPKLYFHEFGKPRGNHRYAIIDGKQRLQAIWAYLDGQFKLSDEFEFFEDPTQLGASLDYESLSLTFPRLKARFDGARLPIVVVQTDDIEMIEEMFSRLNEAVPLNAPEKRNALGGPLPPQIRALAQHKFFTSIVPFPNNRYKHLDIATKLLYVEYRDGLADTKKRTLDDFVKEFKEKKQSTEAKQLGDRVKKNLDRMSKVFTREDYLLSSVGLVVVYYALFRDMKPGRAGGVEVTRDALVKFDDLRQRTRVLARDAEERGRSGKAAPKGAPHLDQSILAFERFMQSPNDSSALKFRYDVLRHFLSARRSRG